LEANPIDKVIGSTIKLDTTIEILEANPIDKVIGSTIKLDTTIEIMSLVQQQR
jgi:hypothetical protein